MVPRGGFEPPALGLEVLCSIQLSYQGTSKRTGLSRFAAEAAKVSTFLYASPSQFSKQSHMFLGFENWLAQSYSYDRRKARLQQA